MSETKRERDVRFETVSIDPCEIKHRDWRVSPRLVFGEMSKMDDKPYYEDEDRP